MFLFKLKFLISNRKICQIREKYESINMIVYALVVPIAISYKHFLKIVEND